MSDLFGSNSGFNSSAAGRSYPDPFSPTSRATAADASSSTPGIFNFLPASANAAPSVAPPFFTARSDGNRASNNFPLRNSTATAQTAPSRRTSSNDTSPMNEQPENFKKVLTGLMNKRDNLKKRISFLSGFVAAFKEHVHTDIQLRPNDGPCIPAHKALLATRSEIFKNILGSDGCKVAPTGSDTITMSELNTEELESLLEFLYTGNLPFEKLEKHVYSLYSAADKYEIPYLHESCETFMLNSLDTSNALNILEISDSHSSKTLKEITLNFIVGNMKDIVSTQKYEDFASSNPNLCVQITRTFVDAKMQMKPNIDV